MDNTSTATPASLPSADGDARAAAVAIGEEAIAAINNASAADGSNEGVENNIESAPTPPASGNNNIQASNNVNSPPHPSPRTLSHIHVHLNTPDGVRGVNIPLPPGVNMPPRVMFQQAGGGPTNNNNQPQAIHIRQSSSSIPPYQPLAAQPLPNQSNYDDVISNQNNLQEPIDLKKFECSICFEYMEVPVRCGGETCSSRFCAPCLSRVLREEIINRNNRNNTNNNNNTEDSSSASNNDQSAKCPHCRTNFTKNNIQVDLLLQKQINDSTNTITCPFKGCNTEVPIGQLKQHEESCPYIRMKCRYAEWGCKWTGRKMDLPSHYDTECDFGSSGPGLTNFIERYRKTVEHDHRHQIDQHRSQLQGMNQMLSMQSRQVMMIKSRNASDIVDVMALSYHACCFTGRFVLSRDLWSTILMKQGCRATLGNMLLSFPTMVLVASVSIQGVCLLQHPEAYAFGTETFWHIADTVLMSTMMLILGILYISCFYIDMKSPYEWSLFSVKNLCTAQPLIRDVAAVCITMIYFLAFEHFEFIRGVIMWHALAFSTLLYTSFVMRMTDKVSGSASPQPRTWSVIVFGLRYGLITSYCDFQVESPAACFFGVVICMRLLKLMMKLPDFIFSESSECFFKLGNPVILVGGAAVWLRYLVQSDTWHGELLDWFVGMLLLAYANFIVYAYSMAGDKLAETSYSNAVYINRAHPAASQYPNPIGCIVFGISNFLLVGVAFLLNARY